MGGLLGQFRSAVLAVLVLTLLLGFAYPLAITGVARVLWPRQPGGSRCEVTGGSSARSLIAQSFAGDLADFQSRPSASGYDAARTAASNLGPNSALLARELRTQPRCLSAPRAPVRPDV